MLIFFCLYVYCDMFMSVFMKKKKKIFTDRCVNIYMFRFMNMT